MDDNSFVYYVPYTGSAMDTNHLPLWLFLYVHV